MLCWSAVPFASGWVGNAVRLCDVAQHVLFAQEPGEHAFASAVFVMMHEVVGNRTAAVNSAMTITLAIVALRGIRVPNSTFSLAVESIPALLHLFQIALVLVRFDDVASRVTNANHAIGCAVST